MKKQDSTYRKVNAVFYNCIYCNLEREMTVDSFSAHLDTSHSDLKDTDKKELIKDITNKISRYNKEQENKFEQEELKISEAVQLKLKKEKEEILLLEYKIKIISVLENSQIKQNKIEQIKSMTGIDKLKRILSSSLKQKFKDQLDEAGIDYFIEPKEKKRKKKKKYNDSKYFDETVNSIKPVYTPMGNKK